MSKSINVNDFIYAKLVSVAGEMTMMSGKPISLGLSIALCLSVFETVTEKWPNAKNELAQELKKVDSKDLTKLDEAWDRIYQEITK